MNATPGPMPERWLDEVMAGWDVEKLALAGPGLDRLACPALVVATVTDVLAA